MYLKLTEGNFFIKLVMEMCCLTDLGITIEFLKLSLVNWYCILVEDCNSGCDISSFKSINNIVILKTMELYDLC